MRGGQNIEGNKLFKSENLANFGLQTNMNIFFGGKRFEDKNFDHTRVQKNMIPFFVGDQDIERSVIPFKEH